MSRLNGRLARLEKDIPRRVTVHWWDTLYRALTDEEYGALTLEDKQILELMFPVEPQPRGESDHADPRGPADPEPAG